MILTIGLKFDKQREEWIILEATKFDDEYTKAISYAIRKSGSCWNKTAQKFIYEPMPSNRDDDFFEQCRFASEEEALSEWELIIKPKLFPEDNNLIN